MKLNKNSLCKIATAASDSPLTSSFHTSNRTYSLDVDEYVSCGLLMCSNLASHIPGPSVAWSNTGKKKLMFVGNVLNLLMGKSDLHNVL